MRKASRCWEISRRLRPVARPAVVSHYDVQPVIDIYASTQGRDLGSVASDTMKVLKAFEGHLPRGSRIVVRGQVATMKSSFFGSRRRAADGHRAGVLADRGEFSVLA